LVDLMSKDPAEVKEARQKQRIAQKQAVAVQEERFAERIKMEEMLAAQKQERKDKKQKLRDIQEKLEADNPGMRERNELLARKFSLVGGSSRWMFGMNDQDAENDINTWIEKTSDKKLILQGLQGSTAPNSVNHLISRQRGKNGSFKPYTLASRYIILQLSKFCEASFVTEAARLSISLFNQAWDGWVFQIDFFMQLRSTLSRKPHRLELKTKKGGKELWDVHKFVEYRDNDDFVDKELYVSVGDWGIPLRWNQPCFDAFQRLPDKGLRIVQVTRAKSHSLKLEYVDELIKGLVALPGIEIARLDFVVVVPLETLDEFTIPQYKIRCEKLLAPFGWDISQLRVLGLPRSVNS